MASSWALNGKSTASSHKQFAASSLHDETDSTARHRLAVNGHHSQDMAATSLNHFNFNVKSPSSGRKSASPHFLNTNTNTNTHHGSAFTHRHGHADNGAAALHLLRPADTYSLLAASLLHQHQHQSTLNNRHSTAGLGFFNNFCSPSISGSNSTASSANSTFGSPVYASPQHTEQSSSSSLSSATTTKLPNTPSRSKSLSPIGGNQMPPRLRHKRSQADDPETPSSSSSSTNYFEPIEPLALAEKSLAEGSTPQAGSKKSSPVKEPSKTSSQSSDTLGKSEEEENKLNKKHPSHVEHEPSRRPSPPALAESTNLVKYKMPMNVRTLNLSHYPANKSPTSKRQYSIILTKMKSAANLPKDQCREVLKNNLQALFNLRIHQTLEIFRKEYIDPVLANIERNAVFSQRKDLVDEDDVKCLLSQLLEDANRWYNREPVENDEVRKRKLDEQEAKTWNGKENSRQNGASEDAHAKKLKSETLAHSSASLTLSSNEVVFKAAEIDDSTQFVLGKNANDLYLQFQQMAVTLSDQESAYAAAATTSDDNNNNDQDNDLQEFPNSTKNIYSKHPNLFKYEADASDRLWLKDNGILKRKNTKCYILLSAEVATLFQAKFFNRHLASSASAAAAATSSLQEQFAKKLKTFGLTGKMIEKVKRKYSFHFC